MLRRLLPLLVVPLAVSCGARRPALSASELLERAAAENQRLASVDFSYTLSLLGGVSDAVGPVEASGKGSMADGGKRLSSAIDVRTSLHNVPLRLQGDIVLQNGREAYLRIRSVAADVLGQSVILDPPQLAGFVNRWWLLPGSRGPLPSSQPDPSLLPLQLRSLDVTDDDGGTVLADGSRLRELSVRVNRQRLKKLLTEIAAQRGEDVPLDVTETYDASGILRIDEATGLLQSAQWELVPHDDRRSAVRFAVTFASHGSGATVLEPDGAMPLLSGVSPLTLFLHGVEAGIPDTMEPSE